MSQAQNTVLWTESRALCVPGSILSQNFIIFFVLSIYFEMRSHSVAQAALELSVVSAGLGLAVIPLPLPPESEDSHVMHWHIQPLTHTFAFPPSSNLTIP